MRLFGVAPARRPESLVRAAGGRPAPQAVPQTGLRSRRWRQVAGRVPGAPVR